MILLSWYCLGMILKPKLLSSVFMWVWMGKWGMLYKLLLVLMQNRKAVYKKRSIYHLKHVGCCSKAQQLIWSQMFSASTDFQENCGRLQMLMTKAITRRLFNAALPERCQQPPATVHQPVREYTLFPSNWRLPGSHCPVSRCLWESLKVNPS